MIDEGEFKRLVEASQEIASLSLYIDQTGGITIGQLAARARRLKRQHGPGLVVVDYLQLLAGSARRANEGRVQEVGEITTGLKALAKELVCRFWPSPSSRARWRTARTSGHSWPICAGRAPSSRMPMSSCSCTAKSIC